MQYKNSIQATFIERPNRFIAYCEVKGERVKVHVKNTGRCKELLIPGCIVYLEYDANPKRKTQYSLISVQKGERLINMDSQVPNKVFYEAIQQGELTLPDLKGEIVQLKPEKTYKHSRFDAYIETTQEKAFIEIKGVTLEEEGIVKFPDAPSERALKHVEELIQALEEGYKAYLIFIVQMKGVLYFTPHAATQEAFAKVVQRAASKGVHILAYDCEVTEATIQIGEAVEVRL